MGIFPDIPVLGQVKPFDDVMIVGCQHLLPTVGSLMEALIALGFRADNIFLLGKCYSTVPHVADGLRQTGVHVWDGTAPAFPGGYTYINQKDVQETWERAFSHAYAKGLNKFVILDEGGKFFRYLKESMIKDINRRYLISGVEQTTNGTIKFANPWACPCQIVDVARSDVKRRYESPFIGDAIVRRLLCAKEVLDLRNIKIGIAGAGAVGLACGHALKARGIDPVFYSKTHHDHSFMRQESLQAFFESCNVILGCTGDDITAGVYTNMLLKMSGKVFASGGSGDYEFLTLLCREADKDQNVLNTIIAGPHQILNGGFPLNFTRDGELEPVEKIALTRLLILSGVLQAAQRLGSKPGLFPLSNQDKLIDLWKRQTGIEPAPFAPPPAFGLG